MSVVRFSEQWKKKINNECKRISIPFSNSSTFSPVHHQITSYKPFLTSSNMEHENVKDGIVKACIGDKCNILIKMTQHPNAITVQQEISMQQEFASHKLAGPIVEAFQCKDDQTSYIFSQAKENTALEWYRQIVEYMKDSTLEYDFGILFLVRLCQDCITAIELSHIYGLTHQNCKLEYFMSSISISSCISAEHCNAQINSVSSTLQFIDFSKAKQLKIYSTQEQMKYKRADYQMLFQSILKEKYGKEVYDLLEIPEIE